MSDSTVALMRATALHAALLSDGAEIPTIPFWRARCNTLVETLQQDMRDRTLPEADIEEISLAQCVLLDELTLHALPSRQHEEWLREPLQRRFHDVRDGAARVWERIDALMNDGHQDTTRLELYCVLLELGFEGERENAKAYLDDAKSALSSHRHDEALFSLADLPEVSINASNLVRPSRRSRRSRMRRMRRTASGVAAGAIAVASWWAVLDHSLDAAILPILQTSAPESRPIGTERPR